MGPSDVGLLVDLVESRSNRRVLGWPRPRRPASVLAVAAVAALLLGCASAEDTGRPTLDVRLQRALDATLDVTGTLAASVAIIFPDGSTWARAAGIADREADRRSEPDTRFAVASITKMFTAALVFRLAEQHRLSIGDPLSRWVPDFPGAAQISVRELLGHTSGVGRSNDLASAQPNRAWEPTEVLQELEPTACAPGECVHYSDTNYVLLGLVAERAGGRPFVELLHRELLDPLGLDETYLQGSERPSGHVADVYDHGGELISDGSVNVPTTDFVTRNGAAGAIASTAADIAAFGQQLFSGHVLTPASLGAMANLDRSDSLPSIPPSDLTSYGLGVEARVITNREVVGHSGSTGSLLAHFREEDVTIAVLLNGAPLSMADPDAVVAALVHELPDFDQNIDVYSIDADGSGPQRLTTDPGLDSAPALSPDGRSIAFVSDRTGDAEVHRMDADGANVVQLTHRRGSIDTSPAWSPDGTSLAFSSSDGDHPGIYVMDAEGSTPRRLAGTGDRDDAPSWAPDGEYIAFHRSTAGGVDIVVVSVASGADRVVASERGDFPAAGFPRWSPDGSRLVYVGVVDVSSPEIKTVRVDDGEVRRITFNHTLDRFPTWGPDGRIAYVHRSDLAVMNGNGGDEHLLTATEAEEFLPTWMPAGDRILFASPV